MTTLISNDFAKIRPLRVEDHAEIIRVMPNWWAGRDLTHLVPKLFAVHFQSSSLVVECEGQMRAFIIGFFSQTFHDEAYIHFVGVDPKYRNLGFASELYSRFFQICRRADRITIRCCTSPLNRGSIEFHKKMGFSLEPGDGEIDGFPVSLNHNKPADHKVQFLKIL